MKTLIRALSFFRPDIFRIGIVLGMLILSIGLNILKPWPIALIVDNTLGNKPFPEWISLHRLGATRENQLFVLILIMLGLHLGHAGFPAFQNYLAIGIGLRGLQRVRNVVFG